jgi:hypothetical protein
MRLPAFLLAGQQGGSPLVSLGQRWRMIGMPKPEGHHRFLPVITVPRSSDHAYPFQAECAGLPVRPERRASMHVWRCAAAIHLFQPGLYLGRQRVAAPGVILSIIIRSAGHPVCVRWLDDPRRRNHEVACAQSGGHRRRKQRAGFRSYPDPHTLRNWCKRGDHDWARGAAASFRSGTVNRLLSRFTVSAFILKPYAHESGRRSFWNFPPC